MFSGWGPRGIPFVPLPAQGILGQPLSLPAPGHPRPGFDGALREVSASHSGMTHTFPYHALVYIFQLLIYKSLFFQPLQTVRFTVSDQTGALINQSAVVDQQNDLVTFSVTSSLNQTSTVLFDIKHVRPDDLNYSE